MDNATLKRIIDSDSSELIGKIQDAGTAAMIEGIVYSIIAYSIWAYFTLGGF